MQQQYKAQRHLETNQCSHDATQEENLQSKLIKLENFTQYTRWFFKFIYFLMSSILCSTKGMWKRKVLFLRNWLEINSWHYLNLPQNTAQPSAPSPEVVGQARILLCRCLSCTALPGLTHLQSLQIMALLLLSWEQSESPVLRICGRQKLISILDTW